MIRLAQKPKKIYYKEHMSKEKECLRQQQLEKMKRHKIVASIEASKMIIARLLFLPEMQNARNIFVYVSMRTEVSTDDLIMTLLKQRKTVCVPKVLKIGTMIPVAIHSLKELSVGRYGFREPRTQEPFEKEIDLVIVPGLAFDQRGNRLGYGGGYYDRYFGNGLPMTSVGLAFDWQILSEVPTESHDHQLDIILTESQVHR